jgi:hypothetical protein
MQENVNNNNISIIKLFPLQIPKDICNICTSFLSENDKIYSGNTWYNFPKKEVCDIAAQNGWFDLLKWVVLSGLCPKKK